MRALLISGSLPPMKCGVGDYTAHLAEALARCKGMSVAVLTDVQAQPIPANFNFEVFPVARGWRMSDVSRIAMAAKRWRPDVVHIQYPTQGYGRRYLPWLLPTLFRLANVPIVQTWHGYDPQMSRRNILNALLDGGLVTVRPEFKAMMSPWYTWLNRRKHFQFIPNASTIPKVRLTETEKSIVRSSFCGTPKKLIAFFGFAYGERRIELLFQVADPRHHHLVLICDLNPADAYQQMILNLVNREPWAGGVTVTGFLPAEDVGRILATADAVVLPFQNGAGMWNTSIRAALNQGTFVLTTALERHGYDSGENIYYARPDDVADMRDGLQSFIGRRSSSDGEDPRSEWESIAQTHMCLFSKVAGRPIEIADRAK
jgi:glycosyltransferase involved in cell wall biosynthesis